MQETKEMQVQSLGQEDPLEKKWPSTPVSLPGESYGQRSLAGYSSWGLKELDVTEHVHTHTHTHTRISIVHLLLFNCSVMSDYL